MSTSNGHGANSWPVLALKVEPADVVPGVPGPVRFAVRNDSGVPAVVRFNVAGLNPEWTDVPGLPEPLAPGDTRQLSFTLTLPAGYPPSELRAALHARALTPGTLVPLARPVSADVVLRVAETGLVEATMPDEVFGAFHGRFQVVVRNRGREPQVVELSGSSPVGRVGWSTRRVRLEPGGQARVRAEVGSKRALTGPVRRVPFVVKVKGRGAPVSLGGTFVQRPWLSTLWLKAAAILTTLAFFAGLATFIVVKLTSTYAPNPTAVPTLKVPAKPKVAKPAVSVPRKTVPPKTTTTGGGSASNSPPPKSSGVPGQTGSTTSAGGSGGGKPATTPATAAQGKSAPGTSAPGTSTPVTSTPATSAPATSAPATSAPTTTAKPAITATTKPPSSTAAAAQDVAITGQVTAANPTGVNVSVEPASLVNATNNVTVAGTNPANSGPVGKLQGSPGDPPGDPPGPAGPRLAGGGAPLGSSFSTTTIGSGFFTFPAQFASPGNYLVTFSKPGYATQKFVVAATGAPVNLNVTLTPGPGSISGLVIGPHGPLGGATVTVTDGTMTCSARTPTEGPVGKWSISGLTTPDTYLVTATAPGYGASTTLVNLAAGKTSSGVDLTVKAGVASIVGTVGSPRGPVGGINVTATDGMVTQSVTTLTGGRDVGRGIVGTYVIPNLSVQGPWAVTASGAGWISQTQRVSLSKPAVAKASKVTANFQLSATTATVMGTVVSPGDGLGGVGVVMTGKLGTYKALTATSPNSGSFALANVLPGHYVLLFSLFGYRSESVEVNLRAGQILMVPPVKMPAINPSSEQKAEITGDVVNLSTGNAVTKGNAEVDGKRALSVPLGNNGSYIVTGLGAGVHRVTVNAPGYEPASVVVDLAMDATAVAPLVLLAPLVAVSGVITSNDGGTVAGAFVRLSPRLGTERCGTASNPSAAPTALVAGPGGKGLGCRADANGDYRVVGLSHGTYNVSVQSPHAPSTPNPTALCGPGQVAPCGYYDSWIPTGGSVTILEGQNQLRNFSMDMDGRLQVDAETPGLGGIMGQVQVGITVTGPFAAPLSSPVSATTAPTGTTTGSTTTNPATTTSSTLSSVGSTTTSPPAAGSTTTGPTTTGPTTTGSTTTSSSTTSSSTTSSSTTSSSTTSSSTTSSSTTSSSTTTSSTTSSSTTSTSTPTSSTTSSSTTTSNQTSSSTTGSSSPTSSVTSLPTSTTGTLAGDRLPATAPGSGCPATGQVSETLTATSGPVLFQGLPAGVYDVCFGAASNSSGAPIATSPNPALSEVSVNSTGSYSAVMLPTGITISGSLIYQVDGKVLPVGCQAAAGAACSPGSVTATWQYYDRTANPPTLLNGTFTTPIGANGFFQFSNVPAGQQVASPTVNLQITAGGFTGLTENNVPVPTCAASGATTTAKGSGPAASCVPGYFPNLTLTALASAVTGSVVLHTGATTTDTAAADLSAVSVAVEGANGASTNVTASVNGSGQIVWHDPAAQQPGWAEPGSYQLSFSAAGYASPPPVQVTVPINTSCTVQPCAAVNIGTIDFFQQPSVTVVAVNSTGTVVNGATFVLYDPATSPPTVVSTQQAPAGANSVTFTGLSLHSQSSYNYQLDVYLNCQGVIVAPFKVSYGQVTDTVTLQSTSCIQGTVSGVVEDLGNAAETPGATGNLVSPLAGVTVSAGNGLSAVTTSTGSFAVFGNPSAATLGVPPGSYTLSVSSVSGYGPATFWDSTLTTAVANPVTVNSGAQTTIGIALVATDITVSGQVTDQATGLAIPGATVFFQGSLPTSPATPGACNSNGTPPAQPSKIAPITTDGNGQFTVCLPPGSWAASFNETNFAQQKVAFMLEIGAGTKTLDVQMTESLNTVSGLVSEVIGLYGPAPLSALTAADITIADDGPNYCGNAGQSTCPIPDTGLVITAPGNGQYSVTGSGTSGTFFQPGENYSITFKVPGFQSFSQNVEFAQEAGFVYILSPTLDADTATVVVDVVTSASGSPIVGASVSLTPPGQESTSVPCPTGVVGTLYCSSGEAQGAMTTGNGGEATFQNVPLGDYQVDVNGSAVAASTASTNFCDDLASAAISGCVPVTSQGQPVNAGTIRLHQATTIVITGELQSGAGTAPPTFSPTKDILVNFFSGTTATGTPLNTGRTGSDGTITENVNQAGNYTAQLIFPGWQTTLDPITVLASQPTVNSVANMPVTAWYVSANGAADYPSPQWALSVYFCAVGNPAPANPPPCDAQTRGALQITSPNGPNGTFAVDAVDTPNFPSPTVNVLLPTGNGNPFGPYVAEACEHALGTVCSPSVMVTVDGNGDPPSTSADPTLLDLPQPAPQVPPAPTGFGATTATGSNAVTLSWSASNTATGYDVFEGTSPGGEPNTPACTTTTALTCTLSLTTGTVYYFEVEASNVAGFSAPSTEVRKVAGVNPPPTPTGFNAATVTGSGSVTLSWSASTTATGYEVFDGTSPGGESSTAACTSTTTPTCTVNGLTTGTVYYFEVEATNIAGASAPSVEVREVAGVNPPVAPTGLTATATTVGTGPGSDTVTLSWNASAGATEYDVFEGTSSGGETNTPACPPAGTPGCTVTGLSTGTAYYFDVKASNIAGVSGASSEVRTTPGVTVPLAPTGLTVTATTISSLTLTWNASTGATEYNVFMGTNPGGESTNPVSTVSGELVVINGLAAGTTYYFVVDAENIAGTSGLSNETSGTPGNVTTSAFVVLPAGPSPPVLLADAMRPAARARGPGT